MKIEAYCRSKAVPPGSALHYSLLGQPVERRRILLALYALQHECTEIIEDSQDPAIAQTKLDWWRQEIVRYSNGAARHPITQALMGVASISDALQHYLNATQRELNFPACADSKQLSRLAEFCGGGYVKLLIQATVKNANELDTFAESFGPAWFEFERLLAVRKLLARGRCYIPVDVLEQYGLDPESLSTTDTMRDILAGRSAHIAQSFQQAEQAVPNERRIEIKFLLILQRLFLAQLREIGVDGFRLLEHRVRLTPLRMFWVAYRVIRQERRKL